MRRVLCKKKPSQPPLYFLAARPPGMERWLIVGDGKPLPSLAEARKAAREFPSGVPVAILAGTRLGPPGDSTRGRGKAH